MPHIAIKGLEERAVAEVSRTLPALLVPVVGGSEADVLIQYLPVRFYVGGQLCAAPPVIVQVDTQPRPRETLDRFAAILTDTLRPHTGQNIEVYFVCNSIELYYHNGRHF